MIRENILNIRKRISPDIAIVVVTKSRTIEELIQVIQAGINDIGENKVQEALVKFAEYRVPSTEYRVRWHLIGHLQTNKVKDAVKIFDLIQSVDSLHLAAEINKQAAKINKIQDILIEVKTSPEATKFGLKRDEAIGVIKEMAKLKNISIKGLMTIAPLADDPEKARPYFRMLREIRDEIIQYSVLGTRYLILSMGMTDDFEVAIQEGANMVRLGRAIFGE